MSSTFDGIYIARSGVQTARANLNVTGQNISNAGTDGYTRQRVSQSAVPPTGIDMLYAALSTSCGEGVSADGIEQLRDKFLDGQYRTQNAQCGSTSTLLSALQDIEDALNETSSDGIDASVSALIEQLEGLTSTGSSDANESTVKEAASLLASKLNTAADQLSTIRKQQYGSLGEYGVDKVNTVLTNIANLNEKIKDAEVAGSPALELTDQRNTLIDELSQYANIRVETTQEEIGSGKKVDTLSIYLADSEGNLQTSKYLYTGKDGTQHVGQSKPVCLVSGGKAGKLEAGGSQSEAEINVTDADGDLCGFVKRHEDNSPYLENSNGLFEGGSLDSYLKLLNESGEFDGAGTAATRGIGYYEKMLDTVAQKLAEVMNADNSTNDAGDNKPLFTDSDGNTANITAANIRISPDWESGYLTLSKDGSNAGDDTSGSNSNISKMISDLASTEYTISGGGQDLFTGSIQEAFSNISLALGQHIGSIGAQDTANGSMLDNIDTRRAALSSVDINEEAVNLIVFNQALAASSRFMTTVDECIDTIINSMGIAGRG